MITVPAPFEAASLMRVSGTIRGFGAAADEDDTALLSRYDSKPSISLKSPKLSSDLQTGTNNTTTTQRQQPRMYLSFIVSKMPAL